MFFARRRLSLASLASLAFAGFGLGTFGCTLATNATSSQCHSQEDCLARGGDFADTTCSADPANPYGDRVCIKLEVPNRSCTTHRECSDRNGGAPYICRSDGRCASLLSPDCQKLFATKDELLNDNTIFIGHVNTGDLPAALGERNIDFARTEINKQGGGGLPPTKPGGPARPLAFVVCTTEPFTNTGLGSIAATDRALEHLSKELLIPIQNGPWTPARSVAGARYAVDNKLLMFTQNPTNDITVLEDNDLVFRSGFPEKVNFALLQPFIEGFMKGKIVAKGVAGPTEKIRVALTIDDSYAFVGIEAKKILDGISGLDVKAFNVGNTSDFINNPNNQPPINAALTGIQNFRPHLVVFGGGPPQVNQLMLPIARQAVWQTPTPASPSGCSSFLDECGPPPAAAVCCANAPRPYMIHMISVAETFVPPAIRTLAPPIQPITAARWYGLKAFGFGYSVDDARLYQTGFLQKNADLPQDELDPPILSLSQYDVTYLYADAIVAIGDQPLTGPNLSKGVRRVADASGGVDTPAGPSGLTSGWAALARGQNLKLKGYSGYWLFDKNGDRPGNPGVVCLSPAVPAAPPEPAKQTAVVLSGFSFDAQTNQAIGSVTNCSP